MYSADLICGALLSRRAVRFLTFMTMATRLSMRLVLLGQGDHLHRLSKAWKTQRPVDTCWLLFSWLVNVCIHTQRHTHNCD